MKPYRCSFRFSFVLLLLVLIGWCYSGAAVNAQENRIWKDATGRFEIEAKFIRANDDEVILQKPDGKQLTIALDKLSPVDQGFVQGLLAAQNNDDNPFREMESSSSNDSGSENAAGNNNDTAMRTLSVDFGKCPESTIEVGKWNPGISVQPELPFELKSFRIPGKRDFFEHLHKITINTVARRGVLTRYLGRGDKDPTTRLTLLNLENGQVVADAIGDGHWEALAIHDDGERIVVQNTGDQEESKGQLGTVRLMDNKIVPLDIWKPYEVMNEKGKEKVVTFASFINNDRLLTVSQNGRVVIWDFESRRPLRRFVYHGACQPSLTHDRTHLAICGGDIVGFVNLDDANEVPSINQAPQMNYWISSAFSPSCKRFAAATMQKLMVWDVESGEVLFEGGIPGLATNGSLLFPHEDFVMINNDKLVEFSTGIKVWRYHGAPWVDVGGETVFVPVDDKEGRFLPMEIPHDVAITWLDRAKQDSDLFLLKKGASVSIDISGIPQKYRGETEQALKKQIDQMGFHFDNRSEVVLKASVTGPTDEAISYHFAGNFVFKQFVSQLNIEYQGKSIWSARATNVPGAVSGDSAEEIKQELAKAGSSPNIGFFSSTRLPDFLQKPAIDSSSGDPQMLGASRVTIDGLK